LNLNGRDGKAGAGTKAADFALLVHERNLVKVKNCYVITLEKEKKAR